jgi:hypothetical protein
MIKMFPVTGSAKLMSNAENAPPGCIFTFGGAAGTAIKVSNATVGAATAGLAVAARAITLADATE